MFESSYRKENAIVLPLWRTEPSVYPTLNAELGAPEIFPKVVAGKEHFLYLITKVVIKVIF